MDERLNEQYRQDETPTSERPVETQEVLSSNKTAPEKTSGALEALKNFIHSKFQYLRGKLDGSENPDREKRKILTSLPKNLALTGAFGAVVLDELKEGLGNVGEAVMNTLIPEAQAEEVIYPEDYLSPRQLQELRESYIEQFDFETLDIKTMIEVVKYIPKALRGTLRQNTFAYDFMLRFCNAFKLIIPDYFHTIEIGNFTDENGFYAQFKANGKLLLLSVKRGKLYLSYQIGKTENDLETISTNQNLLVTRALKVLLSHANVIKEIKPWEVRNEDIAGTRVYSEEEEKKRVDYQQDVFLLRKKEYEIKQASDSKGLIIDYIYSLGELAPELVKQERTHIEKFLQSVLSNMTCYLYPSAIQLASQNIENGGFALFYYRGEKAKTMRNMFNNQQMAQLDPKVQQFLYV